MATGAFLLFFLKNHTKPPQPQANLAGPASLCLFANVLQVPPRQPGRGMCEGQQLGVAQLPGVLAQDVRPSTKRRGFGELGYQTSSPQEIYQHCTSTSSRSSSHTKSMFGNENTAVPRPPGRAAHLHASLGSPKLIEVEKRESRAGSRSCAQAAHAHAARLAGQSVHVGG
jgi:hypothetical protein